MNSPLRLSMAISRYDHTADLAAGVVTPEGIDPVILELPVEEIFYRFVNHREFDVSEMSFAKFCAIRASSAPDIVGLPVFPSRMFRQSALYVRDESGLQRPEQIEGLTVGLPEWAQTAQVWIRGWLQHQVGIDLTKVKWVQAGVHEAGRHEKVGLNLPDGISLTPRPDTSLSDLLMAGEIDVISTAHPPRAFPDGGLRRLLPDPQATEQTYFQETGLFPIMHVIAVRKRLYDSHPWVVRSLLKAFETARQNGVRRSLEYTASRYPVPWVADFAANMQRLWGGDAFSYGVASNERPLTAFTRYAFEQGITARQLSLGDLFAQEATGEFRI